MNCSVSFSLFLIIMAHQSHDQLRDRNSFTNRFFPRHITTKMFVLDHSEIEFLISNFCNSKSMVAKKLHDVNFDDWSNFCSS